MIFFFFFNSQNYYQQDFSCKHERKIGGIGEGAKWVCDPHRIPRSQSTYEHLVLNGQRNQNSVENPSRCLVYSIGNKGNMQFEYGLRDIIGKQVCEIHIFDSPQYIESYKLLIGLQDEFVFFHPWTLKGSKQSSIQTKGDFKTFQETVRLLGHRDRIIDILKIDCEGCEWDTYKDWLYTKVTIMQILVQLHGNPRHPHDFFHKLHYHNYVTFHKEASTMFKGAEYSFIKLAPEFFS